MLRGPVDDLRSQPVNRKGLQAIWQRGALRILIHQHPRHSRGLKVCHTTTFACLAELRWRGSPTAAGDRPVCLKGAAKMLDIEGQSSDVTAAIFW
jgi:hypothetical protein